MRCIILLIFILIGVYGYSQPGKGRFFVSGNISYSGYKRTYSNSEPEHARSLSLSPKVGYFPVRNFAAGIALPASFSRQRLTSLATSTSHSFGLGPFVRYYLPLDEKLFAFSEVSYLWSSSHTRLLLDNNAGTSENNQWLRQIRAGAGLAYFCTRNLAVELLISYQRYRGPSLSKNDGVICEGGFQFYFGK
jgi:hypothetical protein